jgi:hypothetical protein
MAVWSFSHGGNELPWTATGAGVNTPHIALLSKPETVRTYTIAILLLASQTQDVMDKQTATKKLHALSPRANYTGRETAACRRS